MQNPFLPPPKKEKPYVRLLTITIEDASTRRRVEITHEVGKNPDMKALKKEVMTKTGLLFDTIWVNLEKN